ncbi:hypothetical protein C8D03_1483 [Bosea sp. 124]|nr:hypothetical protein C8D03_1483 [Bosea sp. 124]
MPASRKRACVTDATVPIRRSACRQHLGLLRSAHAARREGEGRRFDLDFRVALKPAHSTTAMPRRQDSQDAGAGILQRAMVRAACNLSIASDTHICCLMRSRPTRSGVTIRQFPRASLRHHSEPRRSIIIFLDILKISFDLMKDKLWPISNVPLRNTMIPGSDIIAVSQHPICEAQRASRSVRRNARPSCRHRAPPRYSWRCRRRRCSRPPPGRSAAAGYGRFPDRA